MKRRIEDIIMAALAPLYYAAIIDKSCHESETPPFQLFIQKLHRSEALDKTRQIERYEARYQSLMVVSQFLFFP